MQVFAPKENHKQTLYPTRDNYQNRPQTFSASIQHEKPGSYTTESCLQIRYIQTSWMCYKLCQMYCMHTFSSLLKSK